MTLEEAIEIVESPRYGTVWPTPPKEREAVQLLIEAGNREMECRKGIPPESWDLLPGETED